MLVISCWGRGNNVRHLDSALTGTRLEARFIGGDGLGLAVLGLAAHSAPICTHGTIRLEVPGIGIKVLVKHSSHTATEEQASSSDELRVPNDVEAAEKVAAQGLIDDSIPNWGQKHAGADFLQDIVDMDDDIGGSIKCRVQVAHASGVIILIIGRT